MSCLTSPLLAQPTQAETAAYIHGLLREARSAYQQSREELKQARDSLATLKAQVKAGNGDHSRSPEAFDALKAENKRLRQQLLALDALTQENEQLWQRILDLEGQLDAIEGSSSSSGVQPSRGQETDIRLWRSPAENLLRESMLLLDRLKRFLDLH